jgi:3-methyladenine DNA glycosylase AlkC
MPETGKRKGARRMAEIPADVLDAINRGETQTVNLVEYLAADLTRLLPAVASRIGLDPGHPALLATLAQLPTLKPMQRHWAAARCMVTMFGDDAAASSRLACHASDIARQWAAMSCGLRKDLTIAERLAAIRPFAADAHFAVRETAWLAVRDTVAADLDSALRLLTPWVHEADANLRRFASELTRPRGVWCAHLEALKADPAPGLVLLDPLQADPSRYVQDSVANWLNDAAKSRPDWTESVCRRWLANNDSKATIYICRRGRRSLAA